MHQGCGRVAVDLARVGAQESDEDAVDDQEDDHAQPHPGEERQPGQLLRDAQRVRVGDGGRKAHVGRQDGHPQADQRVPAQRVGQRDHDRHQQHHFLEGAQRRAQEHEGERDRQQQGVFAFLEAAHDAPDESADGAGLIQHGEGAAREEQHHDDDDDRQPAFAAQHFERRDEPAPDGIIRPFDELEGGRVDGLAPVHFDAGVLPRRDDQGQNPGDHHQDKQNHQRLDEGSLADLGTGFLVHCGLLGIMFYQ